MVTTAVEFFFSILILTLQIQKVASKKASSLVAVTASLGIASRGILGSCWHEKFGIKTLLT